VFKFEVEVQRLLSSCFAGGRTTWPTSSGNEHHFRSPEAWSIRVLLCPFKVVYCDLPKLA